jgi:PAS domain S-box-containing protein
MTYDDLMQRIEAARRRLAIMENPIVPGGANLLPTLLEELSASLEELHVAAEELRQQQDELAATRQIAETERQRYQELFEFAPDGYLVTSPEGTIREANRGAALMFGLDQTFLVGKPLLLFVAANERRAFSAHLARLTTESRSGQPFELNVQPREGIPIPAAVTVSRIQDAAGPCRGLRWLFRDVTDHKRAEERIVWLASFPALNPNPILEVDAGGQVHYANDAALRLAPDLRELGLHHPWLADLPSVVAELEREDRESLVREVKLGGHWYEQRLEYLPEASRVRIYCLQITERKRVEEALRRSQDELKRAQAVAHIGSWRWDAQHNEFLWSNETYRIFDIPEGTAVPYDVFFAAVHPLDQSLVAQKWRDALQGELANIEHRIVVGGSVKWVHERAELELDQAGVLVGIFGTVQDITGRKQSEEVLRRAHSTLGRHLLDQTEDLTGAARSLRAELSERVAEQEIEGLGQALERRAAELGALARIGRALTASLQPESMLKILLEEVRSLLGTEAAGVVRHDPMTNELVFFAVEGASLEHLFGARMPATAGILGTCFSERQPLLVHDVRSDPRLYQGVPGLEKVSLRSLVVVPLISKGVAIGVLGTINKLVGAFTEDDVQILVAIADGAAVAIENARLYAAEQHRRRQLEGVRAVTTELTRELDLRRVLQLIMRHAGELLGSRPARVWLWDEDQQVLTPVVWLTGAAWLRGQRLRLGEGVAGNVAEQRRGMIVNDYVHWPKAVPFTRDRATITAVIGEPLLYHDRLLGVLLVDNEGNGRLFTQEDADALALLAPAAAIAIQNARMFGEVQHAKAHLERLSRRLVEVQEAERRHIARELHDEVGQMLTGLKFMLDTGAGGSAAPISLEASYNARAVVNSLLTRVREMSLDLRPAMLDDLGLLPTLLWYVERCQSLTEMHVVLKHVGLDGRRFRAEVETAAYRVVQESLTNVARHARVSEATVRVWADEERLGVQIEDRGIGFDVGGAFASHDSSGLTGMDERTSLLGGRLTVESAPGQGTRVTAEFPLAAGHDEK